jgi:hypothetical protein
MEIFGTGWRASVSPRAQSPLDIRSRHYGEAISTLPFVTVEVGNKDLVLAPLRGVRGGILTRTAQEEMGAMCEQKGSSKVGRAQVSVRWDGCRRRRMLR